MFHVFIHIAGDEFVYYFSTDIGFFTGSFHTKHCSF